MFNSYAKFPEGNMRLCFGSHENVEIQPRVTVFLAALLIFFWQQQVCECALLALYKPSKNCNLWLIITWKWKYSPNSPFMYKPWYAEGHNARANYSNPKNVPVPTDLDISGLNPLVKNCYVLEMALRRAVSANFVRHTCLMFDLKATGNGNGNAFIRACPQVGSAA